jgi:NADPH2:quinone reductase
MANVALMSLIAKGLTLKGLIFGREMATQRARTLITRRLGEIARGTMIMPIDRIFPLADAAEAHRHVETGHPFGRVLMVP